MLQAIQTSRRILFSSTIIYNDHLRCCQQWEEEYDTESSSDSEEDDEPKLKYKRLSNDLTTILNKEAASCVAVHPKFIVLGTHWGNIHILDHGGNRTAHKELTKHTITVNQITIDDKGDYLASCSDDGKVFIHGLCTTDNNQVLNFDRPVKAVAMDPNFYRSGSGKHFVTGDEKLIHNEKGLFGRQKQSTWHEGEGPIRCIKWNGNYIAWSNDKGVRVYDFISQRRITNIPKENPELRADMYRCTLCWKDKSTLLVAWGNKVKVCVIKERPPQDARDLPNRYVEIVFMFTTDYFVCGIAPLGKTSLVLLTYDELEIYKEAGHCISPRPHLRIVEPKKDSFDEINNDALSIRGFEEYRCNDYHLECIVEENMYMIVSPKDVVVALQRDQDDHITWLVEHHKFEEAMAAAFKHCKDLKTHSVQSIGRQYLKYLLDEGEYKQASRLCVKILGRSKTLWEEEVYKFAKIRQLKTIAEYIPLEDPRLSPGIYEMILNEFLQTDVIGFEKLIRDWPSDLYHIQTLVNAVVDSLDKHPKNITLMQCLAELYIHDKKFDKALGIYLQLKHKRAFDLIHRHNLFDSISDKIVLLMNYDKNAAVKMFIDNMEKVPVKKVVTELEQYPKLLHTYLHELFIRDSQAGQDYHSLQVELYAEHDRPQLLNFLQQSNYYPLQNALDLLKTRELYPEMVFLLGRMGNTKEALRLITNQLRDVNKAIDFCKGENDRELWEDLINFSIDKPSFIRGLLQNIGTHVDPIILIQRIQTGMEIPGLRDSLVKIMQDYNLQISLREGCKKILVTDCFSLMDKLVKTQRKANCVDEDQVCHICNERILVLDLRYASNLVMFNCKHTFHEDCLPAHRMESCAICSAQKRGPGGFNK